MLEWIQLSAQATIVASQSSAVLHLPQAFGSDPFGEPMSGPGSEATTRWLLDGVITHAARSAYAPSPGKKSETALTRAWPGNSQWAYRLAGYFHTTRATRRILPRVARRFAELGCRPLADWATQKIAEEAGHDELALKDLSELGYDAHGLVNRICPPRARAWVDLFERLAADAHPVGCLGYAHALERLACLRGAAEVTTIECSLPEGVNATRCLRVHSAIGSDRAHLQSNLAAAAACSAVERIAIGMACHATALICFDSSYITTGSNALFDCVESHRLPSKRERLKAGNLLSQNPQVTR